MKNAVAVLGFGLLMLSSVASATSVGNPASAVESRRSVTVTGNGEVYAVPDRARLTMSVELTRPQLKDAQDETNRIVRDFLAQARALGCKDEDISTAALSVRAEYSFVNNNGTPTRQFAGYHVSRGIELVIRDLDRVGDYLKRATDAGINQISNPQLESSKAGELRQQALANAALDARAKAQILATTLGVKLGTVHSVGASSTEIAPRPPRPMLAVAKGDDGGGGNEEMGFAAGQIRFSAALSADFDLIAP